MAKFDSLSEEKEFVALDAKRCVVLSQLLDLKKSLNALSKDKPSLRSFERLETRIDEKLDQLEAASVAVCS